MFFNTHLSLIARLFRLRHVRPQTLPLALALAGLTSNPAVFAAASRLPGGESQSSNGRILVVDQNSAGAADTNSGSADAPLLTIGKAVEAAGPGTTVVVKGGTYREQVNVDKSGTADSRISIRAAAGERVVISGADRITGWRRCSQEELRGNTNFSSIYCAELDWSPVRLFCEGNPDNLQPARWPRGDRYRPENYSFLVESGNELRMVDSRQLTQPKGFWEGATLGFYRVANDGVMAGRIVAYDPQKHELIVDKPRRYPPNLGTDRYYIENAPGVIGAPGDYCIDPKNP